MKRTDFTHFGGLKFTQNRLKNMQDAYNEVFGSFAKLCGNKVIICGVEKDGSGDNVTDGWISVAGEVIRFIGGSLLADVKITETNIVMTYADGQDHPVHYDKTATCSSAGDFPFSDLEPLLSLQNVWRPGDIKERYCDAAYVAANFDIDGFGINAEKGWRIMSTAVPESAGKVFVNHDPADADFDELGSTIGAKEVTLTAAQQGKVKWRVSADDGDNSTASQKSIQSLEINGAVVNVGTYGPGQVSPFQFSQLDPTGTAAHTNLQPSFVILKLIKI